MTTKVKSHEETTEIRTKGTFECFVAYVTTVGTAFLVLAGLVADEGTLFRETLLTNLAGKRTLAGVCPAVFI